MGNNVCGLLDRPLLWGRCCAVRHVWGATFHKRIDGRKSETRWSNFVVFFTVFLRCSMRHFRSRLPNNFRVLRTFHSCSHWRQEDLTRMPLASVNTTFLHPAAL